jgi:Kef-type K+ transport system membrane component KefB
MGFGTLALLVVVGLLGPALAGLPRLPAPLVVGEIVAGVIVGRSGLNLVPIDDPALKLLSETGFALLMLIVGTHLPVRDPRLRPALGRALVAFGVTAGLAVAGALAMAAVTGLHQVLLISLLLATSSAAIALPVIQRLPEAAPGLVLLTAWITVCDVATVLAIPLVIRTGSLPSVLAGIGAVLVISVVVYLAARRLDAVRLVEQLRHDSKKQHWALDLRFSLLLLFVLAWLAVRQHTSVLVAGFSAGVVIALLHEPRRLVKQLIGLGEGFLVPLFFVTLGASLDLRALVTQPRNLLLALCLAAGSLAVHVVAGRVAGLPVAAGMLATAQMGVPAAVATLGLAAGVLDPGQAAAVLAAVLGSLALCAAGAALLARRQIQVGSHIRSDQAP